MKTLSDDELVLKFRSNNVINPSSDDVEDSHSLTAVVVTLTAESSEASCQLLI